MTPAPRELEGWVTTLKAQLEPAPSNHIGFLLNTMANSMAMRNGQSRQMASRTDAWLLACGALPADLWTEGCTELLRTKTFMPAPGELMALVGRKFEERRRMLSRATGMLQALEKPEAPKPRSAPPVAQADRLRKILAEQRARTDLSEEDRLHNTAHTERALAFAERRAMEPWAQAFFDARAEPLPEPVKRDRVGALAKAVVRKAAAPTEPWRDGEPVYQQRAEEPPPPTEEPEGDYDAVVEP